jgi:CheY-like chemotaxis protein/nitrogen-specific signal transduction histidine kinase
MEHFEAEKLREVDQLKSRFFANIYHEFRTPLTLIKGPVKQIMDGEFAGNLKEQYKMILRNSDRLLGLINQILDLSKLESGEMKLQVAETNIIQYLKGLILSFSPLADRKKITLKFTSNDENISGYIDRNKLEKIANNLLSNAFKFTPENGCIVVHVCRGTVHRAPTELSVNTQNSRRGGSRTAPTSHPIKITISNTGPGIPPDQIDKIFDRFYQADSTYKKDGEGSGIGLALTKELVEACHGEISVTSVPDQTTTFIVTLPIAREEFSENEIIEETETADPHITYPTSHISDPGSRIAHPESDSERRVSNNEHPVSSILLVEDNPDVTAYICSFLNHDYRIISAENGKEGLKKVLDNYPDLIISDVMMPEMDGFEFCQKVKSDERISHIPVILLTAKADLDSKIEGLEFGADDYVTKPFEARELQIRVKNLIEQRKKLREKFTSLVDLNPADIAASSMDEQLLNRLLTVFEDHMEEPDFGVQQLAREIGMSRSHLNRKIQALTNVSTSEFIRILRLQRAARLLSNASGTVSEIAYKVGFNNLSYFSKAFRNHFGKLPSELNKKE